MLNNLNKILFLFFILINSSSAFANNLAIIDLDYLIENSNLGKLMLENLNKVDKQNATELEKKKENLVRLESEIKNKKNIVSKDVLDKEIKDLRKKINDFNEEKDLLVNKFKELKNNELTIFFNKISPIINDYMKENSLDVLIDKKKIFMTSSNADITKIILDKINLLEN